MITSDALYTKLKLNLNNVKVKTEILILLGDLMVVRTGTGAVT